MIHVVAAAIVDGRGRVLIAQRPPGKHLEGSWEFPGGKLESGESRRHGLARELLEEIGITFEHPRPLMRLRHCYPYGEVLLDVWVLRRWRGEPRSLDGQALRWCPRSKLGAADLLPADRPIISALALPERLRRRQTRHYALSEYASFMRDAALGSPAASRERGESAPLHGVLCGHLEEARAAVSRGARFIALRGEHDSSEMALLCESVPMPVYVRGMTLERAWDLGASGIYEGG